MKINLIFAVSIILISCGQNSNDRNMVNEKDAITSKIDNKIQEKNTSNQTEKHETFNENITSIPNNLKQFILEGYSVINISSGDANLDGFTDRILVLRKNTEETTSNFADKKPDKRPFLLLLGQSDSSYKMAFRNDNAINCIDCGGSFGDPFVGTTIKNGYFSIENGIAGGLHWEQVITFKFEKAKNNWLLIKDNFISYTTDEKNKKRFDKEYGLFVENETFKTSKDFGIIYFDKFNIYNENGN